MPVVFPTVNNFHQISVVAKHHRGAEGIRTLILFLAKEALSQLSYSPIYEDI